MKPKPVIPIPIHFKTPGRSYSQIGRKGNVALYAVYSDYFLLHGFVAPYLLIGFELVCIKSSRNGIERYPRNEEFGHSAWSIPKSFSSIRRNASRLRRSESTQLRRSAPQTLLDRSATSKEPALLAPAQFVTGQSAAQAYQNGTKAAPKGICLEETMIVNH